MGARHSQTSTGYTKKQAIEPQNKNFSLLGKGYNYLDNPATEPRPASGGGFNVGGGTAFPILTPFVDRGIVTSDTVFDMSDQTLHYQKINIQQVGGTIHFSFSKLVRTRAVTLTLDVTIGVSGVATISWPSNLFNVPAGLPTTIGSHYILYITGFNDASGNDNYYVINSNVGTGGGVAWSGVSPMDIDKDFAGHKIFNLSGGVYLNAASTKGFFNVSGVSLQYQTPSPQIHDFQIGGISIFQILPSEIDFLADANLRAFNIKEVNDIEFFSTTVNLVKFTTSGDGAQLNFIVNSYGAGDIGVTTLGGNNAIFEINGQVIGTNNPTMKLVNQSAGGGLGFIGSFYYDGNNSSSTRLTYVRTQAKVVTNTAGAEDGAFYLGLVKAGSFGNFLIIDANANLATFQNGTSGNFGIQVVPSTGSGWSLVKSTATPAIYNSADGHQFTVGANTPLVVSSSAVYSSTSSVTLGSASAFWLATYSQSYYVFSTSVSIGNDGSNNMVISLPSAKVVNFAFPTTVGMKIDSNNGFLTLENSIFGLNIAQGNAGQIIKTVGNPMELICTDLIQLDNHLIPQNVNTQTVGTSTSPFTAVNLANLILRADITNTVYQTTFFNVSNFVAAILQDTTHTNIGFVWQIDSASGNKNYMQLVHNTGNDPIDFMYLQVPLWLSAPSSGNGQNSYIQFEEITDPTTPATDRARLYIKDNGSGKSALVIKWESGTVTTIVTEP